AAAAALRGRLERDRLAPGGRWQAAHPGMKPPRVLFNESVVLATLSFWEMLRGALPLTDWWQRVVAPMGNEWTRENLTNLATRLNEPPPSKGSLIRGADPKFLLKLIRITGSIEGDRHGRPMPEIPVDQPTLA